MGRTVQGSEDNKSSKASSGKPAKSMAELMARVGNKVQTLQKGRQITGIIKKLTPGEILMDIGAKGDALVIEFDRQKLESLLSLLKVGDEVSATVISPESEGGFPVVSLRRMLDDLTFKKFEGFLKKEEIFDVYVIEAMRGGYFAENQEGVKGFLPASQVTTPDNLVGQRIQVKIIEFDRAKKKIVFSQKAVSFVTNPEIVRKYIKRGDVLTGQISSVTPYGLYVVIEPEKNVRIEGFVHISEIAYEHVSDISSQFKTGDKIKAEVLDIDSNNRRVNLSIKKTREDKFAKVREKFRIEQKVRGKAAEIRTRGITLEIEEGISGFIPADKIPSGITYEVGQEVECEVVDFDDRRRAIILSPVLKAVPIGYR